MKVFISQPMRGLDDDTILAVREKALNAVKEMYREEEIELIDSFFKDAPVDAKPLWYLGDSIRLLSEADLVVFVNGCEKDTRGCKIEYACAEAYEYKTLLINID